MQTLPTPDQHVAVLSDPPLAAPQLDPSPSTTKDRLYFPFSGATLVAVMIETMEVLDRVEAIVAVEDLNQPLIGSYDLTAEMGIPGQFDDPRLKETFCRTIDAARPLAVHVGVDDLSSQPDRGAKFIRVGARYVSTGTDLAFLTAACSAKA